MSEIPPRSKSELSSALHNQVAVITGAGRGIGQAIARKLAGMGATVVLVARDAARLNQLNAWLQAEGAKAIPIACDLMDENAIASLGRQVADDCGRCDILVNNAAINVPAMPLIDLTVEQWDQLMHTNLRAPYLVIRSLAPMMIRARYGHIINISSLAGKSPLPHGAAYSASKWGLNGLIYSLAEELRQYNVRASLIAPGSVNTHFGSGRGSKDPARMLQPDDVAELVSFLVRQSPTSFVSEVLLRPTVKP